MKERREHKSHMIINHTIMYTLMAMNHEILE